MTDYTSGGLPLMGQGLAQRNLIYNELTWAVNVLQSGVLDRDLTAPPGGPAEGDAYIVASPATGAWAGHESEIAFYFGGVWNFLGPTLAQGRGIWVADEGQSIQWVPGSPGSYQVVPGTGGVGGLDGLTFTSDTGSTADSDPGAGLFKWNNGTQASATTLFFDEETLDGISLATFYASLPATGYIYLEQEDDDSKWQLWKWAAITSGTGYYKFTVTFQAGSSINDNKTVLVDFKPGASAAGGGSGLVLLESRTASASASLDFTSRNAAGQSGATFQSDFDEYLIEIVNLTPATDNVNFSGRVSTDGGSTWISSSSYAHAAQGFNRFGAASSGSDADSKFEFIYSNSDNSGSNGICGSIRLYDPLSTTKYKRYVGQMTYLEGTGVFQGANVHGAYLSTGDVDAIQFFFSSGNIATGTIRVYGVAK
jgi:hypothetical protein